MPQAIPLLFMAAGNLGWIAMATAQVLAVASTVAIGVMEQRKAKKRAQADRRDLQVVLQSAVEAHRTVYGRAKISGPLVYAYSYGADHNFLIRCVALTGHEIEAYDGLWLNDDAVTVTTDGTVGGPGFPVTTDTPYHVTSSRYVKVAGFPPTAGFFAFGDLRLGSTSQTAPATLVSQTGGQWSTNHRLRGRAWLSLHTTFDRDIWTEGLPNVQALIRGKKLYDPRTLTTAYSTNAALAIRDYLVSVLQVTTDRLDEASFSAAANVCDEYVTLDTSGLAASWAAYMTSAVANGTWEHVSGTTYRQRRYTVNGVISADSAPGEVLEQLVFACAGYLSYTGGAWRLVAGAYAAPTLTLTESDLRGGPQFQPKPARRSLANSVRGTYAGPATNYLATDWPQLRSSSFVADDGNVEMPMDLDFPFTNDAAACQRLASIFLYRSRQGVLQFPATLTALALRPGDTVAVTLPRFGFSGEVFRVEGWSLSEDLGVDLVLREEAASIYTWTPGDDMRDPSPQLNLPQPWLVPAITGLAATSGVAAALVQNDGTIVQRTKLAWDTTANGFADKIEIESRITGATTWTPHPAARDEDGEAYLLNLKTGAEHEIRARRVNAIGAKSGWAVLVYTPLAVNMADNMLRNSDWTEDVGNRATWLPDTRALSGWTGGRDSAVGMWIRNYDNGTNWNVGAGGMAMYDPANVPHQQVWSVQSVPVLAEVEYEFSVYCSPHRCWTKLYVVFRNSGGTTLSSPVLDSYNSGSSTVGDPLRPMTYPRLWGTATAPTGAVRVEVYLIQECTASSSPYPFSAWHYALMCVAPAGVTRETATPWSDGGGIFSPEHQVAAVADGTAIPNVGAVFGDYTDTHTELATITYTPTTTCEADLTAYGILNWDVDDNAGKTGGTAQKDLGFSITLNGVEQGVTRVLCITEAPGESFTQCTHRASVSLAAGTTYVIKMWGTRPPQLPATRSLSVDGGRLKLDVYRR